MLEGPASNAEELRFILRTHMIERERISTNYSPTFPCSLWNMHRCLCVCVLRYTMNFLVKIQTCNSKA